VNRRRGSRRFDIDTLSWWRRSSLDIDTLSWLTSSLVSSWVAILVAVFGLTAIVLGGQGGYRPAFQLVAVVVMTGAAYVIHRGALPSRSRFSTARATAVFGLTSLAVMLSALALVDRNALFPAVADLLPEPADPRFALELWWAPVCAALVVMATSPFVPGRVFVPGSLLVVVATVVSAGFVAIERQSELPIADVVVVASSTIFAVIGGVMLNRSLVTAVQGWRRGRSSAAPADDAIESATEVIDRVSGGIFSSAVVPFLERLETATTVTARDQRTAARLARDMRKTLVDHGDRSWLSAHLAGRPAYVTDPYRLAETITVDQRAAIIALIDGLFDDPEAEVFGARLDLAPAEDDAVAVAVTVGLSLPEGRRTSVLAPYYLTVKSVVRRIEWRGGESLVVTFDVDSDRT
jgi:hypothetical protein